MGLKVDYIIGIVGGCINRYHVAFGRAKRICRTNGWRLVDKGRNHYARYEVYQGNVFIGHYCPVRKHLYVILETPPAGKSAFYSRLKYSHPEHY